MFSWEYNKKMLKTYMIDHAEDIGRFWAEVYLNTPKIYLDFSNGFFDEIQKQSQKEGKDNDPA